MANIIVAPLGNNQVAQITIGKDVQSLKIYQEDDFGDEGHGYQPAKCMAVYTEIRIIALRDLLNQAYPPKG